MAVAVVIMATISIFAVITAIYAFTPVVNELGSTGDPKGIWEGKSDDDPAIIARNTAFNTFLALPLLIIGALALWAILSVTRRDYTDF